MNTARKLGLGFGALLLILVVTALAVLGRVNELDQRLREITAFAEAASAAAYEMEIGVAGMGLTVLRYLETPSPELRERLASQGRDFQRYREQYSRAGDTAGKREGADRVGRLFLDYQMTGVALMEGADRRRRLSVELGQGFEQADQRVYDSLRAGIDRSGQEGAEKVEAASNLAAGVADVGNWLGHYTRTLNPAYRTRLVDGAEQLGIELARFEKMDLTAEERRLAERVRGPLRGLLSRVRDVVELENAEQERLVRFLDLRTELDAALHGDTQLLAERDLLAAKESAYRSLGVIRSTLLLLLAGGLVLGAGTALAFGRGIVRGERQLRAERERLRVTLSSIADGVIVTDHRGRVTFMNPVAQALTGWDEGAATGRSLGDVFSILDQSTRVPAEHPVTKVLRLGVGATLGEGAILVSRTGAERPIDDSAAPILGPRGEVSGAVLVFRDVSERRSAERVAAESLRYAQGAVENLWVPLLVLDSDLRVRKASRAFYETFRVRPEETEGRTLEELGEVQWDIARLGSLLAQVLPEKTDVRHFEVEAEFKDLGLRTLQLDASRFSASEGGEDLIVLVVEDITERRALEKAVRERTKALEDADRRKDEFLAMLGHELRNPLSPVRNCLEILKSDDLAPQAREDCREMMERQVRHLTRLTDDLLDVSRITRGRIELRRERVDLRDLVSSGLEAIAADCQARGHTIRRSISQDAVPIFGDPLRLGQVVANLLNNAVRYSDDGGAIEVEVTTEEGFAVLTVRDQGIGVEAQMLPRIFEPFVQVDSSLARSRGGLGIGLALVRHLVELHGGTVAARSEGPGRGSAFTVQLPLSAPDIRPAVASVAVQARGGRARRVLVVEDNRDSAESLTMLLNLAGHEVRVAHDGSAALALVREFHPHLVLLDIGLPGMDGFQVARKLRQEGDLNGTLLVAMTGYGQAEDRQRSKEAGFDRHLTKPVEPVVLYGLLEELNRT